MKKEIKEVLSFQRDDKGQFIPKLVKVLDLNLKETETEIYIIPLTRGEVLRYTAGFDYDNELWINADDWITLNKIISPRFTKDDLNRMRRIEQEKYVKTVLINSGVKFGKERKPIDDFAKRLKEIKEARNERSLMYFLHERGYSLTSKFNNLNSLTNTEIDSLIEEFNKINKPTGKGKNKK